MFTTFAIHPLSYRLGRAFLDMLVRMRWALRMAHTRSSGCTVVSGSPTLNRFRSIGTDGDSSTRTGLGACCSSGDGEQRLNRLERGDRDREQLARRYLYLNLACTGIFDLQLTSGGSCFPKVQHGGEKAHATVTFHDVEATATDCDNEVARYRTHNDGGEGDVQVTDHSEWRVESRDAVFSGNEFVRIDPNPDESGPYGGITAPQGDTDTINSSHQLFRPTIPRIMEARELEFTTAPGRVGCALQPLGIVAHHPHGSSTERRRTREGTEHAQCPPNCPPLKKLGAKKRRAAAPKYGVRTACAAIPGALHGGPPAQGAGLARPLRPPSINTRLHQKPRLKKAARRRARIRCADRVYSHPRDPPRQTARPGYGACQYPPAPKIPPPKKRHSAAPAYGVRTACTTTPLPPPTQTPHHLKKNPPKRKRRRAAWACGRACLSVVL
ncbi:hypothetical protein K438DRAFT_2150002 [Mycena galopus ATCC 62051]|nr:hypothetical protein K438DRAFT_2150002 [Mycena galopus ATCC 62051]